jgi:hypothetical protein
MPGIRVETTGLRKVNFSFEVNEYWGDLDSPGAPLFLGEIWILLLFKISPSNRMNRQLNASLGTLAILDNRTFWALH